jgi:hypothetical protein
MSSQDSGTSPHPSTPPANPKPPRNILALVALIVSVLGVVLACIPSVLIAGWILLPISFVLAIVSLFLKGSGKAFGIAGLVTSVLGTILAIVVAVGFALLSAASSATISTVTGSTPAAGSSTAKVGTRENPYKIPATVTGADWTVVVNSYKADGSANVAATGFSNEPPVGSHWEVVNYTVTYKGTKSSMAGLATVDVVTSKGVVVTALESGWSSDFSAFAELLPGGTATSSVGYVIPNGDKVTIRVTPGKLADPVFLKP